MISIDEAINRINFNSERLPIEEKPLSSCLNHVLAEPIYSSINMPPFNQSAMDGYAICQHKSTTYKLSGEIQAGDIKIEELKPGEAMRIFTGAAVPKNTSFVAQQELVEKISSSEIKLTAEFELNQNIREEGEQIKKNETALESGHEINPASIGFLASLGIDKVKVFRKPKIGFLTTGNELISPGKKLQYGQIYESNSLMIDAGLRHYHFQLNETLKTKDTLEETTNKIKTLIETNDVVLISGGISVGDYDFVKSSLENLGVQELFYKVKQKPGKPIYFGKKETTYIFALPGNPASSLTCFYIYVLPLLHKLIGKKFEGCEVRKLKLASSFEKKNKLGLFLKARFENEFVSILPNQSSAMLNSFAYANCLVYIPENTMTLEKNALVDSYIF